MTENHFKWYFCLGNKNFLTCQLEINDDKGLIMPEDLRFFQRANPGYYPFLSSCFNNRIPEAKKMDKKKSSKRKINTGVCLKFNLCTFWLLFIANINKFTMLMGTELLTKASSQILKVKSIQEIVDVLKIKAKEFLDEDFYQIFGEFVSYIGI